MSKPVRRYNLKDDRGQSARVTAIASKSAASAPVLFSNYTEGSFDLAPPASASGSASASSPAHLSLAAVKPVAPKPAALPASVDLRSRMPPVYDQGQLGSCTANALAACYAFDDPALPRGSRLFLYYNERYLDGDPSEDAGSSITQGIRALQNLGLCNETTWPYVEAAFATPPPAAAYIEASQHEVKAAVRVANTLSALKACLASGSPVVLGIQVCACNWRCTLVCAFAVPMLVLIRAYACTYARRCFRRSSRTRLRARAT